MEEIIGICIGSLSSVVSTLKDRSVHVVLSDTSNREVPTVVSYNERDRAYGDTALTTYKSNYQRTIIYLNRWLGLQASSSLIQEEAKYSNIPASFDKHNKIGFQIAYKGNTDVYNAESLMGLYLAKLRQNWLREGFTSTKVIVSVPDYALAHERQAMIESIQIAGLQCGSLINESSAIALDYGLLRKKEFDKEKTRTVGFVDMGQSKTTIFFGTFSQEQMKVVSVTSERFCGAREFDMLLADHVSKDFQAKYQCNPMKNQKCKIRLLDAVAKARKILTVNKETTINVDSLIEGEDLVYNLTKEEFERIVDPVIAKFASLCKAALEKVTVELKESSLNLHSIEMVGQAVRTPVIQRKIKEVFGIDLSKTLLPDECISRGCVLFGVMNSPYHEIKDFSFEHYNPYTIILEYPFIKNGEKQQRIHKIMPRGDNIPGKKSIKFTEKQTPRNEAILLKFHYFQNEVNTTAWPSLLLNSYSITLPEIKEEKWTFNLTFELDLNCLPSLSKAVIDETYNEEGSKVNLTRTLPCSMNQLSISYGTNGLILEQFKQRETNQANEDIVFHIASHKKNELEQLIYNTREKFNNVLIPYVTSLEKETLTKQMEEVLTWLYSNDGELYNMEVLEERSKEMMEISNRIYSRFNHWSQLEELCCVIGRTIERTNEQFQENVSKGIIMKEDADAIEMTIGKMIGYLEKIKGDLAKGIKTEEPFLQVNEVEKCLNGFNSTINQMYIKAENKVMEEQWKKKEEDDDKKGNDDVIMK